MGEGGLMAGKRLASIAAALGMIAALAAAGGMAGAWFGVWAPDFGVGIVIVAVALAAVAVAAALIAIGWAIRARGGAPLVAAIGLIAGAGLIGMWLEQRADLVAWPPIHDVTTSITSPPRFTTLPVTTNNLQPVPDGGRRELAGLTDDVKWRMWHVERYADVRPVAVRLPVTETIAQVTALARARGWTIAAADPAGHVEASDRVPPYGYIDDIAIDARPAIDTRGTVVSMRSVSRAEGGDGGRNARRIKAFLADLTAAASK